MGNRKRFIPHFLLAFGLWILPFTISNADPLDNWHVRYGNFPLSKVAYGRGTFVAVGGSIFTSADGETWAGGNSEVPSFLNSVTYGNETFVAVGQNGVILNSPDGQNWTIENSGTSQSLLEITFGNGIYMAVGAGGIVLTSLDGKTWIASSSGTSENLNGVTQGNGLFAAVGDHGTLVTSPDGFNWTEKESGTTDPLYGIGYVHDMFVAVGGYGGFEGYSWTNRGIILTSSDGESWTSKYSGVGPLFEVIYGKGRFIAVGGALYRFHAYSYWGSSVSVTSSDGMNWVAQDLPGEPHSITYGNGTFVALATNRRWVAGRGDTEDRYTIIHTSVDGETWVSRTWGPINGVTYGNGSFVAVGEDGGLLASTNGKDWRRLPLETSSYLTGVAYGNGTFVAVGYDPGLPFPNRIILISPDGMDWTRSETFVSGLFRGIMYGGGRFIAVGDYGIVLTSLDGITWSGSGPGVSGFLQAVTYGNRTFVAVGYDPLTAENNAVWTSRDGILWKRRNASTSVTLRGITFGNSDFVAVGDGGTILHSKNGTHWTAESVGNTYQFTLNDVTFGSGTFAAVGGYFNTAEGWVDCCTILSSTDGENWIPRDSGTSLPRNPLQKVTYGNGTFVAVGGSLILQSDTVAYTLRVAKTGFGTVKSSPAGIDCGSDCTEQSEEFKPNEVVTLTAMSANGSVFTGWLGACSGTGACVITMNAEAAVTATFKTIHAVTAMADPGGTISPSGKVSVYSGEEQIFTITPDDEHEVADVRVDGKSVGAVTTYRFTDVRSDHTIKVIFRIKIYVVTVLSGPGGRILPSRSVRIKHGGRRTFTIIPSGGYRVEDVKVDGVSVGAVRKYRFLNITSDHTIEATFKHK